MLKFKYVKVYPCLHQFFSLGAATVKLAESVLSMSQKLEVISEQRELRLLCYGCCLQ